MYIKCTKLRPINYILNYNLKYMKICARYPFKMVSLPSSQAMLSSWASMTSTGEHYKLDLRVHAGSMPNKCTFKCTDECTGCGTGGLNSRAGQVVTPLNVRAVSL